jgi:hypothetical protein
MRSDTEANAVPQESREVVVDVEVPACESTSAGFWLQLSAYTDFFSDTLTCLLYPPATQRGLAPNSGLLVP